jgi:hypothetical protein
MGPGMFGQLVLRVPACRAHGRERDLSACLAIHPVPLPCSETPAGSTCPHLSRICRCCPRLERTKGPSGYNLSRIATWL